MQPTDLRFAASQPRPFQFSDHLPNAQDSCDLVCWQGRLRRASPTASPSPWCFAASRFLSACRDGGLSPTFLLWGRPSPACGCISKTYLAVAVRIGAFRLQSGLDLRADGLYLLLPPQGSPERRAGEGASCIYSRSFTIGAGLAGYLVL